MLHAAPDAPYLRDNYAPVAEEHDHLALTCTFGQVPRDLAGVFVRNGANPVRPPRARHHWFDGDGMVHGLEFADGQAHYRNRWVRTAGFLAEQAAGAALWGGLLEPIERDNPRGPYKNTANTDLVYHHGRLLATWWVCGDAYVLRLPDLASCGADDFHGTHSRGMTAHAKVDPRSGELVFIRPEQGPPFLSCGVLDAGGRLIHSTDIELPGPRLHHDMAITEHHTIILDTSMHEDPALLRQGKVRVKFFRDQPSRFGVLPRHAAGSAMRWFDISPCYIYHTVNAWEDGDAIVVLACRIDDPMVGDPGNKPTDRIVPAIAAQLLGARLCRWRLDLRTGAVSETLLDDEITEFPRIDARRLGAPSQISYHQRLAEQPTLRFDAIVRYDHERGGRTQYRYPEGWYGSEVAFAPRIGAGAAEDDGYLIAFVCEEHSGQAEGWIFAADQIDRGPVTRLAIPTRVPTGFHGLWIDHTAVAAQDPALRPLV